jgi:hypothetical protein
MCKALSRKRNGRPKGEEGDLFKFRFLVILRKGEMDVLPPTILESGIKRRK